MYRDPRVAGSWPDLVTRLESRSAIAEWARLEPALSGLSVHDVVAVTADHEAESDRDRSDQVLAALVRTAATDGGADTDAVLLLLHLLSPGVQAMAARY